MNGMDMQASFHNLTQVDKIQQDGHRGPMIHLSQNAEISNQESIERTEKPNEPEESEGKDVNSESRRKIFLQRERKDKKEKKKRRNPRSLDGGRFVDFTA